MSTILDALRKVAEERTQGGDVRTRLLSFPSRLDTSARRRPRMVWLVSAGVAITGFAAGAGLMYWRSPSPVQEEQSTTLARYTSDAKPTATRAPLAVPSVPPSATTENQPPRRAPDLPQSAPPTAPPIPSSSSGPVLPPPAAIVKDRVASLLGATASLRSPIQPGVPVITKEEPRTVPPPVPTPLGEPSSVPLVQSEPAPGNIPSIPSLSSFPPTVQDALNLAAQLRPPAAEVAPFPDAPFSVPPGLGTGFPPQPPPVAEETTPVQSDVSLSLLQWSPDADKRMAFLRVKGGPLTLAHEGDTLAGFTVTEIGPETVTLRSEDKTWVLQVR